jgi:hypothetical protein
MKHRDVYPTPEEMVARMKSHAGIRRLDEFEALEIALTIVDETQPQGEISPFKKSGMSTGKVQSMVSARPKSAVFKPAGYQGTQARPTPRW